MSDKRIQFADLEQAMQRAVTEGVFPGGVLTLAVNGAVQPVIAVGTLGQNDDRPVTAETVFDLASLSKPLATAAVCLKLAEQGILRLDMRLSEILGPFIPADKSRITVAMLLGHTGGLPAWRPYFETLRQERPGRRKQLLLKLLLDEPLEYEPGTQAVYSDLGYMLLTYALGALTSRALDDLARDLVFLPLGLMLDFPGPGAALVSKTAQTEACSWRGVTLQGQVHDDNAWAAGLPLGHAGLFGRAADVLALAETMRLGAKAPGGFFRQDLMRRFLEQRPDTDKRLGFEAPVQTGASCGQYFSKHSFGHLGFTGTSFWVDPGQELSVALLTNRVNLGRENLKIRSFRPQIHDLAALLLHSLCL